MRFHGASGRSCTRRTPMSRNTGMPSVSMNRSYGVFGRPNLPKPARRPPAGSCQCTLPAISCMTVSPPCAPGAAQREAVRRRPGFQKFRTTWTPDQRCTTPLRSVLHRIRGTLQLLRRVRPLHARGEAVAGERVGEQRAHDGLLVGIIDLVAAGAPADPRLRDPLRVADGDALVLEGEIAR